MERVMNFITLPKWNLYPNTTKPLSSSLWVFTLLNFIIILLSSFVCCCFLVVFSFVFYTIIFNRKCDGAIGPIQIVQYRPLSRIRLQLNNSFSLEIRQIISIIGIHPIKQTTIVIETNFLIFIHIDTNTHIKHTKHINEHISFSWLENRTMFTITQPGTYSLNVTTRRGNSLVRIKNIHSTQEKWIVSIKNCSNSSKHFSLWDRLCFWMENIKLNNMSSILKFPKLQSMWPVSIISLCV
jgi:hypothetical protein